jgi:hypothetical protein
MPHFTLTCTPDGYELTVVIGLTGAGTAKLVASGSPLPRPVQIRGVIDSGSDVSCISSRIVAQLGLLLFAQDTTQTAAGPASVNLYEASLSLPRPGITPPSLLLILPQLVVMELPNLSTGIEALVGRDVLAHLLFFSDGPRGEFTLAD